MAIKRVDVTGYRIQLEDGLSSLRSEPEISDAKIELNYQGDSLKGLSVGQNYDTIRDVAKAFQRNLADGCIIMKYSKADGTSETYSMTPAYILLNGQELK